MEQYRTYLRAELGKLASLNDANGFLTRSGCRVHELHLVRDAGWLTQTFETQGKVDAFVEGLGDDALIQLTRCCSIWRNNSVARELLPAQSVELLDVPVAQILLRVAERDLEPYFARNGYRLTSIARDLGLLAAPPYRDQGPGEVVRFARCLAKRETETPDHFRIFDGMHRAIQLVRNGDPRIPLCVVSEPR